MESSTTETSGGGAAAPPAIARASAARSQPNRRRGLSMAERVTAEPLCRRVARPRHAFQVREGTAPPASRNGGVQMSVLSGFPRARTILACAAGAAALAIGGRAALAASFSTLAFTSPNGLVSSTGNLYWTATVYEESGPDAPTVFRASKGNVPGAESVLYREIGDDRFFGNIVWANPGAFFGYFVANYQSGGVLTSQIKRVPLAGGPAVVIANSPAYIGSRDLVTDGTTLFWVDAGGIRSVPVVGGPVTTLYTSSFVTRLAVDSTNIYFGEEFLIFRKPKAG